MINTDQRLAMINLQWLSGHVHLVLVDGRLAQIRQAGWPLPLIRDPSQLGLQLEVSGPTGSGPAGLEDGTAENNHSAIFMDSGSQVNLPYYRASLPFVDAKLKLAASVRQHAFANIYAHMVATGGDQLIKAAASQ